MDGCGPVNPVRLGTMAAATEVIEGEFEPAAQKEPKELARADCPKNALEVERIPKSGCPFPIALEALREAIRGVKRLLPSSTLTPRLPKRFPNVLFEEAAVLERISSVFSCPETVLKQEGLGGSSNPAFVGPLNVAAGQEEV